MRALEVAGQCLARAMDRLSLRAHKTDVRSVAEQDDAPRAEEEDDAPKAEQDDAPRAEDDAPKAEDDAPKAEDEAETEDSRIELLEGRVRSLMDRIAELVPRLQQLDVPTYDDMVMWCVMYKRLLWQRDPDRMAQSTMYDALNAVNRHFPETEQKPRKILIDRVLRKRLLFLLRMTWSSVASERDTARSGFIEDESVHAAVDTVF